MLLCSECYTCSLGNGLKEGETEGRRACDNLNAIIREGVWHHRKWQLEVGGFKNLRGRMVSATWLGVGGEEVREMKDETQVSRKSTCCATASVRAHEEDRAWERRC